MKSIVQEVLKPANKPKENPLFGSETKFIYSKSVVNTQTDHQVQPTFQEIERPNYQQKNIQKRLAGIPVHNSSNVTSKSSIPKPKNNNEKTKNSKDFVTNSLSKLQTISLVQGKQPLNKSTANNQTVLQQKQDSQFIGETRTGIKAWIFSGLHHELVEEFQRPLKTHSIGVISSEQSTVGQLFLVNEVLREFSGIKYSLTWNKDRNCEGFVLELYEENSEMLSKAVKTLFQKLSQHSYKQMQIYKVQSPSPWLSKQLNINTHAEGAAVLEGINYYSAILLLDRYFKKSTTAHFNFKIEKNHLLLYGKYEIITRAIEELHKQADRVK